MQTLSYVRKEIPFYRDLKLPHQNREPSLKDFPLIDKRLVAENLEQFLNLDTFPDFVISSGGTMSNSGAISFRSQDEYEAVHHYFTGANPVHRMDADPDRGCALDIFNNSNGYFWRKPPGWPVLSVSLEQQTHADLVARLLRDGLTVKGRRMTVRHVQGQCGPMRALTGYFESSGIAPTQHGAPSLLVYGSHTSRVWKQRFERVWGCSPFEVYGLSEFSPGASLKCERCGSFHFWTCWPEFLELDSDEPTASGDARLVLTSLLPFARLQPRIRYLTGDIVTVTGRCIDTGKIGFRFRGRAATSVVTRAGTTLRVLFSERDVLEVVEHFPDIAHQIQTSERQIWETAQVPKPAYAMGYPRFQIEVKGSADCVVTANVLIEVTFDRTTQPLRGRRLVEHIHALLREEVPGINTAIAEGRLVLKVTLEDVGALGLRIKSAA